MHDQDSLTEAFDEIFRIIDDIPEQTCGGSQPRFLYDLSHATKDKGEIVEIGTRSGKSTIALAYGQKAKSGRGRSVHTIDIAKHPDLEANLERADVTTFVQRVVKPSSKVVETWDQDIELLFVDADHRYNGIVSDLRNWCQFVIVGGKVALHDYPGFDGVNDTCRAVCRTLLARPNVWRVVADREAGSIIVFERLITDQEAVADRPSFRNWIKWKINNLKWYFDERRLRMKSK